MFDSGDIDRQAIALGFKRRGKQNWIRRTNELVQVLNLQKSAWSDDVNYLNFALWPLAFGEPPTLAESKMHFRARADSLQMLFALAEEIKSLDDLVEHRAWADSHGMITIALANLLDGKPSVHTMH